MTELLDKTNNVLDIVLGKEDDYYSYFYKKIINNNDILYSSNVLANNLLHIDFNNYVYDEIINILDCAIQLITHTIDILNNKHSYTKEDIKILDFATIQIIDIYSDILEEFLTDEEYNNLKQLRKYTNKNEDIVYKYLQNNYNNSELIKLIFVYVLIQKEDIHKAKEIYNTYIPLEKNHPFYCLGNSINNKIIINLK
jgi:hypothetical protein